MKKKNYKGRCTKKYYTKAKEVCKTYDDVQTAYAEILEKDPDIVFVRFNVLLDEEFDDEYTSDFVCEKADGEKMVRECLFRKMLSKPKTVKMLEFSRSYWMRRGIVDWGIVINDNEE